MRESSYTVLKYARQSWMEKKQGSRIEVIHLKRDKKSNAKYRSTLRNEIRR